MICSATVKLDNRKCIRQRISWSHWSLRWYAMQISGTYQETSAIRWIWSTEHLQSRTARVSNIPRDLQRQRIACMHTFPRCRSMMKGDDGGRWPREYRHQYLERAILRGTGAEVARDRKVIPYIIMKASVCNPFAGTGLTLFSIIIIAHYLPMTSCWTSR